MLWDWVRWVVSRRPLMVTGLWVVLAALLFATAPDLSRLAAEGQAHLLPETSESARTTELLRKGWPDQAFSSLAVVGVQRDSATLTDADRAFIRKLADRLNTKDRPRDIHKIISSEDGSVAAERLVSADQSTRLTLVLMNDSFVAPGTHEAVAWIEKQIQALAPDRPAGLDVLPSGDAFIGRDYMADVRRTLDRATIVTVVLLLGVLLFVYRSLLVALVPLATIGLGLVISRAVLGWMAYAGWEISPLVELFLVVVLFGCGTDYCLFLSWRFAEHWNASNPAGAIRTTLRRGWHPLVASALTTVVGLALMGFTRFKLFSSTGPSVAIGLLINLTASLTLTPALLVLLARWRPQAFAGLTAPSSGIWELIGRKVLSRPLTAWGLTLLLFLPFVALGARLELSDRFVQDMLTELPTETPSVRAMRQISSKFSPGAVAPITVVLGSSSDLRDSQGLALIDDISRLLTHQRQLVEVRSATQPLGSPQPLEPARLASRLTQVNEGFDRMAEGATRLEKGLTEGAARIRGLALIEQMTGISLSGPASSSPDPAQQARAETSRLSQDFARTTAALLGGRPTPPPPPGPPPTDLTAGARDRMLRELTEAAQGARQIADGARRAQTEIGSILRDPVGRRALDRLLVNSETIRANPDLTKAFDAYISPDGHLARIDLQQADRPFSAEAMIQVETLRDRLNDYLVEVNDEVMTVRAGITGQNAESADIWRLTRRDQYLTWIIVPVGVFLVLLVSIRDAGACFNLVATMLLTYTVALGVTWLVFVLGLGAPGLDWKVPYFLFVLLVAVGVDYNVFLMTRVQEESRAMGLRAGINRAIAQTGGLISSAAAITAASFAALLSSPLGSLQQLGFALVFGITLDALVVRPILVPCGHWLMYRGRERKRILRPRVHMNLGEFVQVGN